MSVRSFFITMIAAAFSAGGVSTSLAQGHREPDLRTKGQGQVSLDVAEAVGELPEDLDLVAVINSAAELRGSPIGASAMKFISDSGMMAELGVAWQGLSSELGWTPSETFDRLLGSRVVLVSRSDRTNNLDRHWAILSDVSLETEQRLKSKLKVAPREIDKGHQILSVENGRFELTGHHRAAALAAKTGVATKFSKNDRVTLVFAPAENRQLFDDLVAMLAAGTARPIRTHDIHRQLMTAGPSEVVLAFASGPSTVRSGNQTVDSHWQDFVLLTGRREAGPEAGSPGLSWKTRVQVRNSARKDVLRTLAPSSSAPFDALASGSLLTVLQNTPLPQIFGSDTRFTSILAAIPLPDEAKPLMGDRQAISIRTVDADHRVSITMAAQTSETATLAKLMDTAIPKAVQAFERRMGVDIPPPVDYEGVAPNAARVVNLACSTAGPLSALTSRPLAVTWSYPSHVAVNGPLNILAPSCTPEQLAAAQSAGLATNPLNRPGWIVLNICQESKDFVACDPALQNAVATSENLSTRASPDALQLATGNCKQLTATHAEYFRNDANALLTADHKGEIARWVMLSKARPVALEAVLPPLLPDFRGLRSAMRRVDLVDARLKITDEGDILGSVMIRLADLPSEGEPATGSAKIAPKP